MKAQQVNPTVIAAAVGGDDQKAMRTQVADLGLGEKYAWINNQQDWPDVYGLPKDNLFVLGFLGHSILNNLFYPIVDLARGGYGDVQILREGGGSVPTVHIVVILHSLSAIARLFLFSKDFKARFLPWSTQRGQGLDVVWNW